MDAWRIRLLWVCSVSVFPASSIRHKAMRTAENMIEFESSIDANIPPVKPRKPIGMAYPIGGTKLEATVQKIKKDSPCSTKPKDGIGHTGMSGCVTSWKKNGRCAWLEHKSKCAPNCVHPGNQKAKKCELEFCVWTEGIGCTFRSETASVHERQTFCSAIRGKGPLSYEQKTFCGQSRNGEGELVQTDKLRTAPDRYLSKDKSIAIIGAGPAGLHMARELQKRGFKNISILEMTDRVGGKSFTRYLDGNDQPCQQRKLAENGAVEFDQTCVPIEYGTCFLHNGYHRVRDLVHEYHIRHEARTYNALSIGEGFDFIQQVDAEGEHLMRSAQVQQARYEEALQKALNDLELEARLASFKNDLAKPGQFHNNAENAIADKQVRAIQQFKDSVSTMLRNLSKGLQDNLSAINVELYRNMNKTQYQTWQAGSYSFHVTDLVLKGMGLRGLETEIEEPEIEDAASSLALGASMKHFVNSLLKYVQKRKEVFGDPKFIMPHTLSPETLKDLSVTFREWLNIHGLASLVPFFQVAHAAQGYGYLWEVPAYYGLSWMHPDFVVGVFVESFNEQVGSITGKNTLRKAILKFWGIEDPDRFTHLKQVTTMLPEGYHSIWREMHKVMTINNGGDMVHFNITDLKIDRKLNDPNAPVRISWKDIYGVPKAQDFDFLMYSGPLKYAEKYIEDIQENEKDMFNRLEAFTFAVTVYRTNTDTNPVNGYTNDRWTGPQPVDDRGTRRHPWQSLYLDPVTLYNADNIVDGPRSDFKWYVDRNDPRQWAPKAEYKAKFQPRARRIAGQFASHDVHLDVNGTTGERLAWWGTGALGSGGMQDDTAQKLKPWLLAKLKEDMRQRGVEDIEVLEQVPWPYFWHFGSEDIAGGKPWELVKMQGKLKTWYLGASSSFESINDIVNYNLMLLDKSAFTGFPIKHMNEYGKDTMVQPLDSLTDTDSRCCCDFASEQNARKAGIQRSCALVPGWSLRRASAVKVVCPEINMNAWPMTKAKAQAMEKFKVKRYNSTLKLATDKDDVGCSDMGKVVVLTTDAYCQGKYPARKGTEGPQQSCH